MSQSDTKTGCSVCSPNLAIGTELVTLWRERHGLCKSHFVERNWYMFPAKIFPAEIFPQFVQTQHSRTLPTDQKSKSRRPPPPELLPQHAPRPLRAHPTQLTQNTRRSACSSAPSNHPRPFGCKNNAHRRSSNGGTGSNAIARLCLARPTFFKSFLQVKC